MMLSAAAPLGDPESTDVAILGSEVRALFSHVLNREPGPSALSYFTSQLVSGLPLKQFAAALTQSDEYLTNEIVRPDYQRELGRAPSNGEMAASIATMKNGATDEQFEAALAASDTFFEHVGATDVSWLDAAYQAILSRPAEPAGKSYWLARLASGDTRAEVALGITSSFEREAARVEGNYQAMLDTRPDAQSVDYWVSQLAAGTSDEDVIAFMADTREFFQQATGVSPAAVPLASGFSWSPGDNQAIESRAAQGNVDVLFAGDSLTADWPLVAGDLWNQDFAVAGAMNAGVPGDTTGNLLWRLQHGDLNGIDPKLVVLMIGTNNVGLGGSPDDIAAGIKANLDELRSALPDAKILVMGVPPQGPAGDPKRQTIARANAIVATFADGTNVYYVDLSASLLTSAGELLPGAFDSDNTHLTAAGYQIWANAIVPLVQAWA